MELSLEVLGMTQEELQNRVVDRIVDKILNRSWLDDEGESFEQPSALQRRFQEVVQERINKAVEEIADKHILPNVTKYIENLTLQETNRWGEKAAKPITFIEYLVKRAEVYMVEEVNYEGKTQEESRGYSWNKSATRVAFLIEKHLHYSIATAMETALKNANSQLAKGLEETCKIKLQEIANELKVEVKTR